MRSALPKIIGRILFWGAALTTLFLLIDRGGDERIFTAPTATLAGGEPTN